MMYVKGITRLVYFYGLYIRSFSKWESSETAMQVLKCCIRGRYKPPNSTGELSPSLQELIVNSVLPLALADSSRIRYAKRFLEQQHAGPLFKNEMELYVCSVRSYYIMHAHAQ